MSYIGNVSVGGSTHLVGSTLYGTCTTAANTAAKVVTCANFDQLLTGVTIHVKFTYSNTASNPTLNVNGTGAKRIYCYGNTSAGTSIQTSWNAGAVIAFTYDGTYWFMNDWLNTVNTYSIANDMSNGLVPKTLNGTYSDVHFLMDDTTNRVAAWGVPPNATSAKSGYMSAADKTKLDGMKTVVVSTSAPSETYASVWVDPDEEGDRIIPEMMIHKSATLTASNMPFTISDSRISSIMRVCNTVFGTPAYVRSDISWTTGDGYVTFTGTISGSTSIDFDLIEAQT